MLQLISLNYIYQSLLLYQCFLMALHLFPNQILIFCNCLSIFMIQCNQKKSFREQNPFLCWFNRVFFLLYTFWKTYFLYNSGYIYSALIDFLICIYYTISIFYVLFILITRYTIKTIPKEEEENEDFRVIFRKK